MDAFADFFPELLTVTLLLAGALTLAPLAQRIGLPGPAAFLSAGIVAGLLGITPFEDASPLVLQEFGAVALYVILFQGGLSTGFRAFRENARPTLILGLPGTAATAAGLALAGHLIGLDWNLAILVGVALAPTDPAAVYATLRGAGSGARARAILEGESGFNDPIGISFMVVAVAAIGPTGASFADGAARLAKELGIGVAGGIVGAALLLAVLKATPKLEDSLQSIGLLVVTIAVGATTATLHGSGFLAVFLCGLILSDAWSRQDSQKHAVPEALAATAEPLLFGLLGAVLVTHTEPAHIWQGLVLTLVTVFIVRPPIAYASVAGCGLSHAERVLISWGGLKGAVPLLLGLYPALESLAESRATQGIVLVATTASILVQGATLKMVARRVRTEAADVGIVHGRAKAGG